MLLPILILVWISACTPSGPRLPTLSANAVILAFGDSLTYGTGAGKDASYPTVLARLTGRRIINAGVPGELSAAGLRRLPGLLDKWHPGLLLLCHGGNDLLQRRSGGQLRKNLEHMIQIAEQRQVPVLLIAVPRPGLFLQAADLYADLAKQYRIPIENNALPEIIARAALKSDQVHPNAKGYRLLAKRLYTLLHQSGAL